MMKKIKISLLNSNIQNIVIVCVFVLTLVERYFLNGSIIIAYDFYSPIFYFLVTSWVYYSFFFYLNKDELQNEVLVKKRNFSSIDESELNSFQPKIIKLSLVVFFGYSTYFVFGVIGVIISLIITTFSYIVILYISAKIIFRSNKIVKPNTQFLFIVLVIGYFYFFPWKKAFCSKFGTEEIGSFFEKDTYKAKYIVKIKNLDNQYEFKLPADIIVSNEFTKQESYEREGIGRYSGEVTEIYDIRYIKVNKVYFEDNTEITFDNCLISLDDNVIECIDNNGSAWEIRLTNKKVFSL